MPALIGDLSITVAPGVTLTSHTDVGLAEQWAAHAYGAEWPTLNATEQARETGAALRALRDAFGDINAEESQPEPGIGLHYDATGGR